MDMEQGILVARKENKMIYIDQRIASGTKARVFA
jgi:hypothetical protein